jgi:hypothetical protein
MDLTGFYFYKEGANNKYPFTGTGTRDLIWLKVVSLDRSWLHFKKF